MCRFNFHSILYSLEFFIKFLRKWRRHLRLQFHPFTNMIFWVVRTPCLFYIIYIYFISTLYWVLSTRELNMNDTRIPISSSTSFREPLQHSTKDSFVNILRGQRAVSFYATKMMVFIETFSLCKSLKKVYKLNPVHVHFITVLLVLRLLWLLFRNGDKISNHSCTYISTTRV